MLTTRQVKKRFGHGRKRRSKKNRGESGSSGVAWVPYEQAESTLFLEGKGRTSQLRGEREVESSQFKKRNFERKDQVRRLRWKRKGFGQQGKLNRDKEMPLW